MLLLIEESNKDREEMKKEITEVKKSIAQHSDNTSIQEYEDKLKTDLMKFTQS